MEPGVATDSGFFIFSQLETNESKAASYELVAV